MKFLMYQHVAWRDHVQGSGFDCGVCWKVFGTRRKTENSDNSNGTNINRSSRSCSNSSHSVNNRNNNDNDNHGNNSNSSNNNNDSKEMRVIKDLMFCFLLQAGDGVFVITLNDPARLNCMSLNLAQEAMLPCRMLPVPPEQKENTGRSRN